MKSTPSQTASRRCCCHRSKKFLGEREERAMVTSDIMELCDKLRELRKAKYTRRQSRI
ncbi:hypothetical protein DPMN_010762 [Dreissena polymorpha]|uniref:Uncharacterized protein n=1 Tax=Dreissena polymorpha TaxID=45954 RepID=A0A9D4N3R7_DREPO|nr:hypothetical protein DPMN_010762 [Dreissena polymorpha]